MPVTPAIHRVPVTLALAIATGVAAGSLVVAGPLPALAAGAACAAILVALAARRRLEIVAVGALCTLITGYLFLGRGFAYIAFGPVYVGEVVLALLVLALVVSGAPRGTWRSGVLCLYAIFAGWGAFIAAGDFSTYGLDTIRDSAIWYYGLFMVLCSWLFGSRARLELFVRWVARIGPWFIVWVPISYTLFYGFQSALPSASGSGNPIVDFKGGDVGVTLAVMLAFVVVCRSRVAPLQQRWPVWTLWLFATADFVLIATKNRGGMLCVLIGVLVAVAMMPSLRLVQGVAIGATLIAIVTLANVQVQEQGRSLSVGQLETNALSIVDSNANPEGGDLSGTESWREQFWRDIIKDTFHGHYFWEGHGFGINIADYYRLQPESDGSLRDSHDATMTVLARMGVPGMVMWITLNLAYAGSILGSFVRARRLGDRFWMTVFTLLLVHWLAATIDSSFDPYLEGPQGAIVFWCGMGIGVAARRVFHEEWLERCAAALPRRHHGLPALVDVPEASEATA